MALQRKILCIANAALLSASVYASVPGGVNTRPFVLAPHHADLGSAFSVIRSAEAVGAGLNIVNRMIDMSKKIGPVGYVAMAGVVAFAGMVCSSYLSASEQKNREPYGSAEVSGVSGSRSESPGRQLNASSSLLLNGPATAGGGTFTEFQLCGVLYSACLVGDEKNFSEELAMGKFKAIPSDVRLKGFDGCEAYVPLMTSPCCVFFWKKAEKIKNPDREAAYLNVASTLFLQKMKIHYLERQLAAVGGELKDKATEKSIQRTRGDDAERDAKVRERRLQEAEAREEDLQKTVHEAKVREEDLQKTIRDAEVREEDLRKTIHDAERDAAVRERKLLEQVRCVRDREASVQLPLLQEIEVLNAAVKATLDEKMDLMHKNKRLQGENEADSVLRSVCDEEYEARLVIYNELFSGHADVIAGLLGNAPSAALEAANVKIHELEEVLVEAGKKEAEVSRENDSLKEFVERREKRISTLEAEAEELNEDRDELELEVAECKKIIEGKDDLIKNQQAEMKKKNAEVSRAQSIAGSSVSGSVMATPKQ